MFLLLLLFKAESFGVWSVLFCAVFFMTIWKVCVLFWVLLEVAFELCKMYLIFFFEACTSCLPYEISDHKISLQIWSQFSSVLWQLFSGEFSWFAIFFPFFSSFLSFPVSLTMSCAASLWKRWTFLISILQAVCVEEVPWGVLGEQDWFLVRGNFVHRPVATICSSFYPVSRAL